MRLLFFTIHELLESVPSETHGSVVFWNQRCVEVGELTWKGWRGAFYQNLGPPLTLINQNQGQKGEV